MADEEKKEETTTEPQAEPQADIQPTPPEPPDPADLPDDDATQLEEQAAAAEVPAPKAGRKARMAPLLQVLGPAFDALLKPIRERQNDQSKAIDEFEKMVKALVEKIEQWIASSNETLAKFAGRLSKLEETSQPDTVVKLFELTTETNEAHTRRIETMEKLVTESVTKKLEAMGTQVASLATFGQRVKNIEDELKRIAEWRKTVDATLKTTNEDATLALESVQNCDTQVEFLVKHFHTASPDCAKRYEDEKKAQMEQLAKENAEKKRQEKKP